MKITITVSLLLMVLIAAFAPATLFAEDSHNIVGVIEKISLETDTFIIRVGSETRSFTYGYKTEILNDAKHIGASELKPGDRVFVKATEKDFALRVEVLSPEVSKE